MEGITRYPERILSFSLLVVAALFWLVLLLMTDPVLRLLVRRKNTNAVRKFIGSGARFGFSIFKLWGLKVTSNQASVRLPSDRPIIFVASHHSSLDMCFLLGILEKTIGNRNLRFVARPGLDRGIPIISYYIKSYCYSLGSAGAYKARKQKQDKVLMALFSQKMNAENGVLTIFPEGIKPRNLAEHSRTFNTSGLSVIIENMPDALVVPLAIKGTGEFYCTPRKWKHLFSGFPRFGISIKVSLLPALEQSDYSDMGALINHCEALIHKEYHRLKRDENAITSKCDAGWEEVL